MTLKNSLQFLFLCGLFLFTETALQAAAAVKNLRVEFMRNPVGIDVTIPQFSWEMESNETGQRQTAYQITLFAADKATEIWTSGKTLSDISLGVKYTGSTLLPSTRYRWTVSVWDKNGAKITSAEKAFFETGLLNSGWSDAQWLKISSKSIAGSSEGIPLFRTEFTLTKKIKSARIYSSALGIYDLFVNGNRVGTPQADGTTVYGEFKPGWTDYRKTVFYSTYDITNLLVRGRNAVGAEVNVPGVASVTGESKRFVLELESGSYVFDTSNNL